MLPAECERRINIIIRKVDAPRSIGCIASKGFIILCHGTSTMAAPMVFMILFPSCFLLAICSHHSAHWQTDTIRLATIDKRGTIGRPADDRICFIPIWVDSSSSRCGPKLTARLFLFKRAFHSHSPSKWSEKEKHKNTTHARAYLSVCNWRTIHPSGRRTKPLCRCRRYWQEIEYFFAIKMEIKFTNVCVCFFFNCPPDRTGNDEADGTEWNHVRSLERHYCAWVCFAWAFRANIFFY